MEKQAHFIVSKKKKKKNPGELTTLLPLAA
jgi:hypothetical protein